MNVRFLTAAAALGLGLTVSTGAADAIEFEPIQVGSGLMSSFVQVDFFEGDAFLFEVFYSEGGTTGMDLLLTLDSELGDEFTLEFLGSEDSAFITGLGYDDFLDQGKGLEGDDWWRYWIRDDGDDLWAMAGFGPSSREVSQGSWDGWVFGRDDAPVAMKIVPAPPATLALAGLLIAGRRRRRDT